MAALGRSDVGPPAVRQWLGLPQSLHLPLSPGPERLDEAGQEELGLLSLFSLPGLHLGRLGVARLPTRGLETPKARVPSERASQRCCPLYDLLWKSHGLTATELLLRVVTGSGGGRRDHSQRGKRSFLRSMRRWRECCDRDWGPAGPSSHRSGDQCCGDLPLL